jgi:hypothetical protein
MVYVSLFLTTNYVWRRNIVAGNLLQLVRDTCSACHQSRRQTHMVDFCPLPCTCAM